MVAFETDADRAVTGYRLGEMLHAGIAANVHRMQRAPNEPTRIIKVIRRDATRAQRLAFEREYRVLEKVGPSEGSVRAVSYEEHPLPCMILEDGGTDLARLGLPHPGPIHGVLKLGVALCDCVDAIHEHGYVHCNINPTNIVLDTGTGRPRLIDFGAAVALDSAEARAPSAPASGHSLRYLPPEQSGRHNRSVDQRSDLYALGATLYELLTGRPPFDLIDPAELVQAHLARTPTSPRELRGDVSPELAQIILRLLAKDSDHRYQTVRGLRHDLKLCFAISTAGAPAEPFVPGTQDFSRALQLPDRLYGRDGELDLIAEMFADIQAGSCAMVLVTGQSGIGKSALVDEACKQIALRRGYVGKGKFEQYRSDRPYAALVEAFRGVADHILAQDQQTIERCRTRLREAMGAAPAALTQLCPEIEWILGTPTARPQGAEGPADVREQLHYEFRSFIAATSSSQNPVCLVIDDLQWADADSLRVLRDLLHPSAQQPLLVIGAYRMEDTLESEHLLNVTLAETVGQGSRIVTTRLHSLRPLDVERLLCEALRTSRKQVAVLSELLLERTEGNPFFLRSFLRALHADGVILRAEHGWEWSEDRIRERQATDNVGDLLAAVLDRLPLHAQGALQVSACIGARFDLQLLRRLMPEVDVSSALAPALEQGLVLRTAAPIAATIVGAASSSFCFAHDRVQQAILAGLDEATRIAIHGRIGGVLLVELGADPAAPHFFDMVAQLNRAMPPASESAEIGVLARMNLDAARQALRSAAAEPALAFAQAGITCLGSGGWNEDPVLAGELHAFAGRAACMLGSYERVEELCATLQLRVADPPKRVVAFMLLAEVYYAQHRPADQVACLLAGLQSLGIDIMQDQANAQLAETEAELSRLLAQREAAHAFDRLDCSDERAACAMAMLDPLCITTHYSGSSLFPFVTCKLLTLSIRFGNTQHSVFGYVFYGVILASRGRYAEAARFAQVAIRLAERFNDKDILCRTHIYAQYQLLHFVRPLYKLAPALLDAYRYGQEARSPFQASCSAATLCIIRFFAGHDLGELSTDMEGYARVIRGYRQEQVLNWHQVFQQTVLNLRGCSEPIALRGPAYDESSRVPIHDAQNDIPQLLNYTLCKTLLLVLHGEGASGVPRLNAIRDYFEKVLGSSVLAPSWALVECLAQLDWCEQDSQARSHEVLAIVDTHLDRLRRWLPHCPESCWHKLRIIEAERARLLREDSADELYREAVELANRTGYVHEYALCAERAGRHHSDLGRIEIARSYLSDAHAAYLRWGADGKAAHLASEFATLRIANVATLDSSEAGVTGDFSAIDLSSVLRASQAISKEINLDRLLTRLMHLVADTAGAESGALLIPRNGRYVVAVRKHFNGPLTASVLPPAMELTAEDAGSDLPVSIINYVARTSQAVVLDDVARDVRFASDPYLAGGVRSVLCLPLLLQSRLKGILYLENRTLTRAFMPSRLTLLHALSAQAAISIENAELYGTLEDQVELRTGELRQRNQELQTTLGRLQDAQQRLIVQDRLASLGSVCAGIAHELRNPLNFVKNFAVVSSRGIGNTLAFVDARSEFLNTADRAQLSRLLTNLRANIERVEQHGDRMEGIIRSMLDHARPSTGLRQQTDLNALIRQYASLASHAVRSRQAEADIQVELDLEEGLPSLDIIPQEIGRVLINLIDNACQALLARKPEPSSSPSRGSVVKVTTRSTPEFIELRVRDNGPGIPRNIRTRIFEPFFTTRPPGTGTGLGLSISHDIIVRGNGGKLDLESVENEFTEFTVSFPKAGEAAAQIETA